jgi:hypothetical protein
MKVRNAGSRYEAASGKGTPSIGTYPLLTMSCRSPSYFMDVEELAEDSAIEDVSETRQNDNAKEG